MLSKLVLLCELQCLVASPLRTAAPVKKSRFPLVSQAGAPRALGSPGEASSKGAVQSSHDPSLDYPRPLKGSSLVSKSHGIPGPALGLAARARAGPQNQRGATSPGLRCEVAAPSNQGLSREESAGKSWGPGSLPAVLSSDLFPCLQLGALPPPAKGPQQRHRPWAIRLAPAGLSHPWELVSCCLLAGASLPQFISRLQTTSSSLWTGIFWSCR